MKNGNQKEYIFGPVPSRRLGRSLGVDLVPFKTCSYDCIYCQLGRTTNKTVQRKPWVSLETILSQLQKKLSLNPDYITLSGSGEPTLFSECGELIDAIKEITDIPVTVLTNGSLLWLPEVRKSLLHADLVVPSLDAGSKHLFQYINRPQPDVTFNRMLEGLVRFRDEYQGQYWLEVFLLAGVNTTEMEIKRLQACIRSIEPDRVQVNTVTRPPAEDFAEPVGKEQLEKITAALDGRAQVIADYRGIYKEQYFIACREDIVTMLQRRPCSIEDIAAGLGLHRNEVVKYIEELCSENRVEKVMQDQRVYYKVAASWENSSEKRS
jgi:wyosine [tRNA(Phe)-imidazoG37] synthetase (radical SAM superfamily)